MALFTMTEASFADDDVSKLDILSLLIDMQLEKIVETIFSNLGEEDVANAVTANPKWSAIAANRARVKILLSNYSERSAPLKTFYRREELLARRDSLDARSIFLRACVKLSSLNESHRKRNSIPTAPGHFRLAYSSEGPARWLSYGAHISSELIALVFRGASRNGGLSDRLLIQLFERWTFRPVDSLTILNYTDAYLTFFEDGVNALLVHCFEMRRYRGLVLNLTTGKVHALPCSFPVELASSIAKLIVVIRNIRGQLFATVYKVCDEADGFLLRLADSEPLHAARLAVCVRGAEGLDRFALYAGLERSSSTLVFQVRSTQDFSLLRTVSVVGRVPVPLRNSVLLSDRFVIVYDSGSSIDVLSLVADFRTVHRFDLPEEILEAAKRTGTVSMAGRFLVLHNETKASYAAIWKLASDFVWTCHRHEQEGTVGVTSQCDQLITEECPQNADQRTYDFSYSRFDCFGILMCSFNWRQPPAFQFTMLNSIISDGED